MSSWAVIKEADSQNIVFFDYNQFIDSALHTTESELSKLSQKIKSYSISGTKDKDSLSQNIVFYPLKKDKHSAQIVLDQKTISELIGKEKTESKKNKGKL